MRIYNETIVIKITWYSSRDKQFKHRLEIPETDLLILHDRLVVKRGTIP